MIELFVSCPLASGFDLRGAEVVTDGGENVTEHCD
jgi:hypothetical protein